MSKKKEEEVEEVPEPPVVVPVDSPNKQKGENGPGDPFF